MAKQKSNNTALYPSQVDPKALPEKKLQKDMLQIIQAEGKKKHRRQSEAKVLEITKPSKSKPKGSFGHIPNPFRDEPPKKKPDQTGKNAKKKT